MNNLFLLLISYQFKHFFADYPLQNKYMLGKFKNGLDWILPLSLHCLVHAIFTYIIVIFFNPNIAIFCAGLDFILHFMMDRIKASPNLLGQYNALSKNEFKDIIANNIFNEEIKLKIKYNTFFWWALGLDQMFHHLTHYLIIYIIVVYK